MAAFAKRFGILLLVLTLLCVPVSADLYAQEDVFAVMEEAWQYARSAAVQDPIRQQEVTAETAVISYYDFSTEDLAAVEMDVCSITDGVYTMQYIT